MSKRIDRLNEFRSIIRFEKFDVEGVKDEDLDIELMVQILMSLNNICQEVKKIKTDDSRVLAYFKKNKISKDSYRQIAAWHLAANWNLSELDDDEYLVLKEMHQILSV